MKELEGGLENVSGYQYSAVKAEIRYKDRLDLSLIASRGDCTASAVFTTNKICAAPVRLSRERINGKIRAILINATNANACTGLEGYENAVALTADAARGLGIPPESVLMASTGIIGVQLPREKIASAIPDLTASLDQAKGGLLARAIMTTDTVPKETAYRFSTSRGEFTLAGTAKGSGMIAPNMATLLAFLVTDAPVAKADLDEIFFRCIDISLNALTIDGDTSTNDTAVILSPASADTLAGEDLNAFEQTLKTVLDNLAHMLIMDAEGATRLARIVVTGAATEEDARKIAHSAAGSLLVKTALFGRDPNWGRLACAAGYSGAEVREETLSIFFEKLCLLKNGVPQAVPRETIMEIMSRREYSITIDAGIGTDSFTCLTCDISYDYVKINAEYST